MAEILITGGTGFIGSKLALRLATAGSKIRCLVRESSPPEAVRFLQALGEVVYGDLLDPATLVPAVKGIPLIFHAGGGGRFGMAESACRTINYDATRNLLDACRGSAALERFVHVSTVAVMGHIDRPPADETWPAKCEPIGYARAKAATEQLVLGYADALPIVVVRLPGVYGAPAVAIDAGQIGGVVSFLAILNEIKNQTWMHIGSGRNLVHSLHVDNAVEGLILASRAGRLGEVYILADGDALTMRQMAAAAAGILGVAEPKMSLPIPLARTAAVYYELKSRLFGGRPRLDQETVTALAAVRHFDVSKAAAELGYKPATTFTAGIKSAIDWYAENGYL